ncbi:MAG: toxin HipA [Verrucomicrobiales bacterium]|nr:toxin HipA [Verrucomicrobiales bacterium]
MPRRRQHPPLLVLLNNHLVGRLSKEAGGAVHFQYDQTWLARDQGIPVSLSLPLREEAYRGESVIAVFDNLLPDSDLLRRRIAEKVGAAGTDAYNLLAKIGRDCVGALQFIPDGIDLPKASAKITGEIIDDLEIENLLKNLSRVPLGLDQDQDFRISIAGAQEKTALLHYKGKWRKPHGATPATHILKTQIGKLQNGLDLSNSVENEFYCLKLLAGFGLPVASAAIKTFGQTTALVIDRFDRQWIKPGHLIRVPQEDMCQALGCAPSRKYQNQGGPGIKEILELLDAAASPAEDQKLFLKAQILFWLIGATDGHAKNFSIFLGEGGNFRLAPLYDVLTAQPSCDSRQVERKLMMLAMSVGDSRHYQIDSIEPRHFIQSANRAGVVVSIADQALREIQQAADDALDTISKTLPPEIPRKIHESVSRALKTRLKKFPKR